MKKIHKAIVLISAIFLFTSIIFMYGCEHTKVDEGYKLIRIHIRANSTDKADQAVKLKVRDALNAIIEDKLSDAGTFDIAYKRLEKLLPSLKKEAESELRENGFGYGARVKLNNEFFPTRTYEGVVVESGYYDALIVELGDGAGDNWWCVVYPPLCYVSAEGEGKIEYRSLIAELWRKFISTFRS